MLPLDESSELAAVSRCIRAVVIATRRPLLDIFFDRYSANPEDSTWYPARKEGLSMLAQCVQVADEMKGTQHLRDLGQCLWLDNITLVLLSNAAHRQHIDELSVPYPATAIRIGRQEE